MNKFHRGINIQEKRKTVMTSIIQFNDYALIMEFIQILKFKINL